MTINNQPDTSLKRIIFLPKKVVIIGTSGSGKTTVGNQLAQLLGCVCTDLDDLYWLPNWQKREETDFFDQVMRKVENEQWILCGNYARNLQKIWPQADTIIWLDLSLSVCLWRGLKRSINRILTRETHCNGNYEMLKRLFSKDSILLWIVTSYFSKKKAYEEMFAQYHPDQNLIRLCNERQVKSFFHSIKRDLIELEKSATNN